MYAMSLKTIIKLYRYVVSIMHSSFVERKENKKQEENFEFLVTFIWVIIGIKSVKIRKYISSPEIKHEEII